MIKKIRNLYNKARSKPVGFSTDLESNFYTLIMLILISIFMSSCSTIEISPGVCYNDKEGSHICPEKENDDDERDMEEFEPIYEYCEPWEFDSEAWMNCIMNEESRRNLIRRLA